MIEAPSRVSEEIHQGTCTTMHETQSEAEHERNREETKQLHRIMP